MSTKNQLLRSHATKVANILGQLMEAHPEERAGLMPGFKAASQLARLSDHEVLRTASMRRIASDSLFDTLREYCTSLAQVSQKILRKVPELTAHKVSESNHWTEATVKASRTRYRLQFGIDACDLDTVLVIARLMEGGQEIRRMELDGGLEASEIAEQACDALIDELGIS